MRKKLDYIEETGVNCLHLMPFLDTVKGRDDGGYAVADFRTVRPDLGTMGRPGKADHRLPQKGHQCLHGLVMNPYQH